MPSPHDPRSAHLLVPFWRRGAQNAALFEQYASAALKDCVRFGARIESVAPSEVSLLTPHEHFICQHAGLSAEQPLPYAALHLERAGMVMDFCNWTIGRDQLIVNCKPLDLSADEDAQLYASIAPLFAEDGLKIAKREGGRWCVEWEEARIRRRPKRELCTAARHRR
jgi:hypothetical protein